MNGIVPVYEYINVKDNGIIVDIHMMFYIRNVHSFYLFYCLSHTDTNLQLTVISMNEEIRKNK